MSTADLISASPFADASLNSSEPSERDVTEFNTIEISRNASLTLGTDSLIVLDEGFSAKRPRCCGLLPQKEKTTRAIPFFNILWADLQELEIVIHYAQPASKEVVRVAVIQYLLDKVNRRQVDSWIERLLERAYGASQRNKRIKVLINPFGGQGKAQKWYNRDIEPIFAAARCIIDVERTKFKGHAIEIAENIDVDSYDVIASCSGDGLPHEVFNGLARKGDARKALTKIAVVQLPCGTGNAMSISLNGTSSNSLAALCIVKGIRTPMDLMSVTQGSTRTLSFLSQSLGIVAESDLGTEHLRWLGDARFTYGFLVRLLRKTVYPCDLAFKVEVEGKANIRDHYRREINSRKSMEERRRALRPVESPRPEDGPGLPSLRYGTINDELPEGWEQMRYDNLGNFYSGNMPYMAADTQFFPAAVPHDGCVDLVTIDGDVSRTAALRMLMAVSKNSFFDDPLVKYRKISGYRITPRNQRDGFISIDGEKVPFAPIQGEVHRGLGTVLTKHGNLYEAEGLLAPCSESS